MRVVIAGSRSFNDYGLLCKVCDFMLVNQNESEIEIVSGMAAGADTLAINYAKERGYKLKEFPAPWNDIKDKPKSEIRVNKNGKRYWKLAGIHRNKLMAEYADALIAFMEKGGTKGTQNMIDLAKEKGLKVKVSLF